MKQLSIVNTLTKILFFLVILSLGACSGSSSSGSDAGSVALRVTPGSIELNSLGLVSLNFTIENFDDLEVEGITIKFILPDVVGFVGDSSLLVLDTGASEITPIFTGEVLEEDDDSVADTIGGTDFRYIIFSIPGESFSTQKSGRVEFRVRANAATALAEVFVDLDRRATGAFNPESPSFDVEGMTSISVVRPKTSETE